MRQLVEDLGTHVRRGAAVGVDLLLLVQLYREGEVDQLELAVFPHEHVLRFEVSVRDADFVAVAEGLRQRAHVVLGLFFGQGASPLAELGHVLAVEVLEDQVRLGEASLRSKSTRRCRRF